MAYFSSFSLVIDIAVAGPHPSVHHHYSRELQEDMVRIMVAVDSDKTSERAFKEAVKGFSHETDKIYLCSMYVKQEG